MNDQLDWLEQAEPKKRAKRGKVAKGTKAPLGPPPEPIKFDHWLSRCIDGETAGREWAQMSIKEGGDPDWIHRKDWSFEYQKADEDWNPIGEPYVRLKTR